MGGDQQAPELPTTESIRSTLDNIVRSGVLTDQQADLLKHVVDTYLDGLARGLPNNALVESLSEKALAIDALGFNKEDKRLKKHRANVRGPMMAMRLRLPQYYISHPEEDVLIDIPPAKKKASKKHPVGYVPTISWRLSASAYQRSRQIAAFREGRTRSGFEKAIQLLNAILRDHPEDAPTEARLAEVYALQVMHGITPPTEDLVKAWLLADKALRVNNQIWSGHVAKAAVHLCRYEWDGAEKEFQIALDLNAERTCLQVWYFFYLVTKGELSKLIQYYFEEIQRSQDNVPATVRRNLGLALILANQPEEAIGELEQLLLPMPQQHFLLHIYIGMAYHETGKHEQALEQLQKARAQDDHEFMSPGMWVLTLAQRDKGAAEKELESLEGRKAHGSPYLSLVQLAIAYLGLGKSEKAIEYLEQACDSHDPLILLICNWPMMRVLHDNPRFEALLRKMNHPQHQA